MNQLAPSNYYIRYSDEYVDGMHRHVIGSTSNTSDAHLFVIFGEMILQNTI